MVPKDDAERLKFIRDVDALRAAGKTIDDAVSEVRGSGSEPSAARYVEWKGLVDLLDREPPASTFERVMRFFSTGIFFMLVGGGFIYYAARLHGGQHTAFTFILAVLGIAILLFGTGTQSAGQIKTKEDSAWKIQGSLAGGAGVLAVVFGWALLAKHEDMREAFEPQTQYMVVSLQMTESGTNDPMLVRDRYLLEPLNGFSPVPVSALDSHFEILVPYPSHNRPCSIKLNAVLHKLDQVSQNEQNDDKQRLVEHFEIVLPHGPNPDCKQPQGSRRNQVANSSVENAPETPESGTVLFRRIPAERNTAEGSDIDHFVANISFAELVTKEENKSIQIFPEGLSFSPNQPGSNVQFRSF